MEIRFGQKENGDIVTSVPMVQEPMPVIEMDMTMGNDYYTPEELSKILKLHTQTILLYIRRGKLSAVKLGKGYRISKEELDKFVKENKT